MNPGNTGARRSVFPVPKSKKAQSCQQASSMHIAIKCCMLFRFF
ncbi:hypothetical protein HMPREF1582_00608 [Gardnerella vaginalis JCP8151A]|nr:hypothetical protein HMPREF1582_00608 [Gardnerella vaginalis JCP8151A]